ncbi:GNAT family N-acetyltransferase [Bosea sp. 2KB_26]|uniref:GNAT family N-acetyltransferase n=1 Tax=Bosea sp. 2KB_26 TaxID=3237475 RepID=UPI003F91C737
MQTITPNSRNVPTIRIEAGIRAELLDRALDLYWQAFSRKLLVPLGPAPQARGLLRRCIQPAQAFTAIAGDGQLIGIVTFKTDQEGGLAVTHDDLRKSYGPVGGIWRGLLLNALDSSASVDEMMIESICVDESARGKGVGQALMAGVISFAREAGKRALTLDVVDSNEGARRLYQNLGFRPVERVSLGLLAPVFGFHRATRMALTL